MATTSKAIGVSRSAFVTVHRNLDRQVFPLSSSRGLGIIAILSKRQGAIASQYLGKLFKCFTQCA